MAISKAAKPAREKRLLKRLEQINVSAKTTDMGQEGRELATRVFHKALEDQKKQVRGIDKSK